MEDALLNSLLIKRYPEELTPYFNRNPFISIQISSDTREKMMQTDYIRNFSTRFWGLLQTRALLQGKTGNVDYCDFLLEVFLNQCLSCTDSIAACLNYFLNLQLSGPSVAIQNERFHKALKHSKYPKNEDLDVSHEWVKKKLFPYRNIVHHRGKISSCVNYDLSCCFYPNEDDWDFELMADAFKKYPNHTSYLIATDQIRIPICEMDANNKLLLNSKGEPIGKDPGDSHKYIPIDQFFDSWINKMYELVILRSIEALCWHQNLRQKQA